MKAILLISICILSLLANAADTGSERVNRHQAEFKDFIYDQQRTGRLIQCESEEAVKMDFLSQLKRHAIYGDEQLLGQNGSMESVLGGAARFYRKKQTALGIHLNDFSQLQTDSLFDGSNFEAVRSLLQPGDILLNMEFYNPVTHGKFYAKRAMIHARMVVEVGQSYVTILDSGWGAFSKLRQIHAQTVWLRPRKQLLPADSLEKIQSYAKAMERIPYDNLLLDDLDEFRDRLHKSIDEQTGNSVALAAAQAQAAQVVMSRSARDKFLPFGEPEEKLPKGLYCSEGPTAIYSYLGFKLFGETPFDVITSFSEDGSLPGWSDYDDALNGFGAGSGPTNMMHKLFHSYFQWFDSSRNLGFFPAIPGVQGAVFTEAMIRYRQQSLRAFGESREDILLRDLNHVHQSASTLLQQEIPVEMSEKLNALSLASLQLAENLQGALQNMNTTRREMGESPLGTVTELINYMFFDNLAYGPHHFMENGQAFGLMGVFYNMDLNGGYQAKWVVDYGVNNSTTQYQVVDELPQGAALPSGCVPGEVLPRKRTAK